MRPPRSLQGDDNDMHLCARHAAGRPRGAQPGDRRPTTDRVVCYRHQDFDVPEWLEEPDLAVPPPPPHNIPHLRGVVLLDLPDIDSRAAGHREIVHRLISKLDVLVVVTDVDKYADRVLYRELNALPQAPRNLIFVLNATDRLEAADTSMVKADFLRKLERFASCTGPMTSSPLVPGMRISSSMTSGLASPAMAAAWRASSVSATRTNTPALTWKCWTAACRRCWTGLK